MKEKTDFKKGSRVRNSLRGRGKIISLIGDYGATVEFDNGDTSGMFLRELMLVKNIKP